MQEYSPKWKLLDHTADVRIEVHGESLENLFLNAAQALTHLLVGSPQHVEVTIQKSLTLEGDSMDILLVDWLREILFYFSAEQFVCKDAVVRFENPNLIQAQLSGFTTDFTDKDHDGLEIKGVTYHGLSLDETADGFVARVIFDI